MKKIIDGLALINSSSKNLEWWMINKAKHNIENHSYELIQEINKNLKSGLKNNYRYRFPGLTRQFDNDLQILLEMDTEAQAIDFRIIYNPPPDGIINEGRITRANPYNLSIYGN